MLDNAKQLHIGKNLLVSSWQYADTGQIGEFKTAPFLLDNFIAADGTTEYAKEGKYKAIYTIMSEKCPSLIIAGSDEDHFKFADLSDTYVKLDKNGDGTVEGNNERKLTACIGAPSGDAGRIGYIAEGSVAYTGSHKQTYDISGSQGANKQWSHTTPVVDANVNARNTNIEPKHITMIPQFRYQVDKVDYLCPYGIGDIYMTTSPVDPSNKWDGTTWEQIEDGRYLECTTDSTILKNLGNEELPNVRGQFGIQLTTPNTDCTCTVYSSSGAIQAKSNGTRVYSSANGTTQSYNHNRYGLVNIAHGQTNADGTTYVNEADSVYKDGGAVKPKNIKVFGYIRTA